MRILRRPRFLLDLAEELTWLNDRAGADVADAWYLSLKETLRQLQQHPHLGRPRKDLRAPGIRTWRLSRFPRWLVFYEVTQKHLILYRVRQGSMDLAILQIKS
jgi:plasmid stabilization system protein ParE